MSTAGRHSMASLLLLLLVLLMWNGSRSAAFVPRPPARPFLVAGMAGKGFGGGATQQPKKNKATKHKKKKKKNPPTPVATISSSPGDDLPPASPGAATKEYPPLDEDEIARWMEHVPVYVVTDETGEHAQAISVGGQREVVYLFLSSVVAEAYRKTLEASNSPKTLVVSGMFLGKIWFELLRPSQSSDTEYRLVPDPRDLTSARTVLDLETAPAGEAKTEPEPNGDSEEEDDDDLGEILLEEELPAFSQPFNEIPLFYVDHMPLERQPEQVREFLNKMVSTSYMFFSTQNMFRVLDEMQKSSPQDQTPYEGSNDALCSLFDVVAMMKEPSTIDFRNVVLVPPSPIEDGTVPDRVLADQLADPSSLLSQTFLLPLLRGSDADPGAPDDNDEEEP